MKSFWTLLWVAVVAAIPSCISDTGIRIPDGVYREPSRVEVVTVKAEEIQFRLRMLKGPRAGEVVTRRFDYAVDSDGGIHFGATSGDLFVIQPYDWSWDGTKIVRRRIKPDFQTPELQYDETVIFARE